MRTIQARLHIPAAEQEARLKGYEATRADIDELISGESVTVLKPDGTPLVVVRHQALAADACANAYSELRKIRAPPMNRFTATMGDGSDPRQHPIRKSGYRSRTHVMELRNFPQLRGVSSAIIGYYDRNPRFPYCRQTAFTAKKPGPWAKLMPFVRDVDRVFAESCPERYEAQKAEWSRVHPDFRIDGTAFTTITVNRNWRTRGHLDAGDFKGGFGVMTAMRAGAFDGAFLCFPAYRVAVNMTTRDVCLADVHEWHCNTPFEGAIPGRYERISCVFYLRSKMPFCGSHEEERDRAANRRPGDPLYNVGYSEDLTGEG